MSPSKAEEKTEWLHTFMPLGCVHGDSWEPRGAGVLLIESPMVWLVTARQVIEELDGKDLVTWVRRKQGPSLLNISNSQRTAGTEWIHNDNGVSATLFPVDPSFNIKAFTSGQCTTLRSLQPLQPVASLGALSGMGINRPPHALPAVHEGVISTVDPSANQIHATAPMLPRNTGAPLMLASPYGGQASIAGILLGNTMLADEDPRVIPVRLSTATAMDSVLDLIRSTAATEQRKRVTKPDATTGDAKEQS